jgi:hypothetical protein
MDAKSFSRCSPMIGQTLFGQSEITIGFAPALDADQCDTRESLRGRRCSTRLRSWWTADAKVDEKIAECVATRCHAKGDATRKFLQLSDPLSFRWRIIKR